MILLLYFERKLYQTPTLVPRCDRSPPISCLYESPSVANRPFSYIFSYRRSSRYSFSLWLSQYPQIQVYMQVISIQNTAEFTYMFLSKGFYDLYWMLVACREPSVFVLDNYCLYPLILGRGFYLLRYSFVLKAGYVRQFTANILIFATPHYVCKLFGLFFRGNRRVNERGLVL